MRETFRRIIKPLMFKHMSDEDKIAWKGFLIGVSITVFIIFPIFLGSLIFIYEEHTDVDEILTEYVTTWFM